MSNIRAILTQSDSPARDKELSRLLSAAVINERFCKLLLANPREALSAGYGGETFHLRAEETRRVGAIRAASLSDFAAQLSSI
jgi:hypothetical protein